jgi:hypothetical protein
LVQAQSAGLNGTTTMTPPLISIPEGLDKPLPYMLRVRQHFNADEVEDVDAKVATQFRRFAGMNLTGKSVAIAIGSRGIPSQKRVVPALVRELHAAGAEPFITAAMGSHGGGTAEGQRKILEGFGLGEAALGISLRSSMDVVEVGRIADDLPIYCDRHAWEADFVVPCNRVKPHTNFRARHESGLCKMLAIGLGKHVGAFEMHRRGMERFGELLPLATELFLSKVNVLFGVAIVENAYSKPYQIEFVAPDDFLERDAALLVQAKDLIPRILLSEMDVLIVDEMGKDISGMGMDPNVTGRAHNRCNDFGGPDIRLLFVRDLTDATGGNATGIGVADVTTRSVARKFDRAKTYVNMITAGQPGIASLPLVATDDRQAMLIVMHSCPMATAESLRIVRIENTSSLSEIWVSMALRDRVEAHPDMEILSDPFALSFSDDGMMFPLRSG